MEQVPVSNNTSLFNFGTFFIYSTLDLHTKTIISNVLFIIIHNHSNKVSIHNIYLLVGMLLKSGLRILIFSPYYKRMKEIEKLESSQLSFFLKEYLYWL
jgi:hypothetical protein